MNLIWCAFQNAPVELKQGSVLRFAASSREYVFSSCQASTSTETTPMDASTLERRKRQHGPEGSEADDQKVRFISADLNDASIFLLCFVWRFIGAEAMLHMHSR
jgi:hypothetical protein